MLKKKIIIPIGANPSVSERMLGIIINSNLNSHDEIGVCVAKLRSASNALRASDCLSRVDRIDLAKLVTHAKLGNFVFIVTHAIQTKLEFFRKTICQTFKKSAYLPISCPTDDVESFIFGMSFNDYMNNRIVKFVENENRRNPNFLQNIVVNRNRHRVRRGKTVGVLLKKYIYIKNTYSEQYLKNLLNIKRKTTIYHKKKCLEYKPNF